MKTKKHKPPEWREPAKHNIRIRNKILAQDRIFTKDATPEDTKRLRSFVVTCKRMGFRVFDGGRRS